MKLTRRQLCGSTTAAVAALAGCQALTGGDYAGSYNGDDQIITVREIKIINKSKDEHEIVISVVKAGESQYRNTITVPPNNQEMVMKRWKGYSFAIFATLNGSDSFGQVAIDNKASSDQSYRVEFIIQKNGNIDAKAL